ncbi:Maf family protein [Chondromyces crocatus]|uniref:dTTP/UTP pyrophosphatase n=1 Tax=Chondromyces crocatus TaxID=52 RepID=A0A0K1ERH2_CHOCO|nr:nucleoside triphosphate pyrophosphatase [Chondromyces crocatus]AKT43208.1 septum formation inhibitor Maf [Chondromyces crocatus]
MIDHAHPLLLGSSSPRRRDILTTLGIPFRAIGAAVAEVRDEGESAEAYQERIVLAKLEAAVELPGAAGTGAVLVADTEVILDGQVLGKPRDEADGRLMLRSLSGRAHEVWTCFAIAGSRHDEPCQSLHLETVRTRVLFRHLADEEIASYSALGEGLDKAGAYAIQGVGAFVVERIEGSYMNVVGLPACEVILALRRTGLLPHFPIVESRLGMRGRISEPGA